MIKSRILWPTICLHKGLGRTICAPEEVELVDAAVKANAMAHSIILLLLLLFLSIEAVVCWWPCAVFMGLVFKWALLGTFRFNWSVWHTGMHYLSLDRHCLPAPPCHHGEDGGQVNSSVQNRSTRRPYNIIPFSETHYTHRFCAKSYLARQFQGGWGGGGLYCKSLV